MNKLFSKQIVLLDGRVGYFSLYESEEKGRAVVRLSVGSLDNEIALFYLDGDDFGVITSVLGDPESPPKKEARHVTVSAIEGECWLHIERVTRSSVIITPSGLGEDEAGLYNVKALLEALAALGYDASGRRGVSEVQKT